MSNRKLFVQFKMGTVQHLILIYFYFSVLILTTSTLSSDKNLDSSLDPSFNFQLKNDSESYPYYISVANRFLHHQLFEEIQREIMNKTLFFNEIMSKTQTPQYLIKSMRYLKNQFNFTLPLRLDSRGEDASFLLNYIKKIIQFSSHSTHPYNLDRHSVGLDPYALIGDWLATAMSSSLLTYQIAPVFTLMEGETGRKLREIIGYSGAKGDVITVHGRTTGNGYAIQVALQNKFSEIKQKGLVGSRIEQPVLFVSRHGAESIEDICVWQGIGSNFCVRVDVDLVGRMNVTDLEHKIRKNKDLGRIPFIVIATAGTSILGAIDPMKEISQVAKKYKLWFHVDAFASNAFLSFNQKHKVHGIERSDSFLWNVDQSMGAPHVTNILVTRHEGILHKTFDYKGRYTTFSNQLYNSTLWDRGSPTLQGLKKIENHVDYVHSMTNVAIQKIQNRNISFELIQDKFDSHYIAFYYIPLVLRNLERITRDQILKISKYTETLRLHLLALGFMSLSVNTFRHEEEVTGDYGDARPPFFLMNLGNSALESLDIDYILNRIEEQGESSKLCKLLWDHVQLLKIPIPTNTDSDSNHKHDWDFSIKKLEIPLKEAVKNSTHNLNVDFMSTPIRQLHEGIFEKFWKVIFEQGTYFDEKSKESHPAQSFKTPQELMHLFDFSLDNPIGGSSKQEFENDLITIVKKVIKYSSHFGHPFWNYHHLMGVDPYSAMADYLVSSINHSEEFSLINLNPVFNLMEQELLRAVRILVGYSEHGGDGLILPGGSAAIQVAALLARMVKQPKANKMGIVGMEQKLTAFISTGAHFATGKGIIYMGIGLENVINVDVDEFGRMDPIALRKAVKKSIGKGQVPFLVVATSGSTVFGAFDPLDKISDVCQEFQMWLHVDGTYGGVNIFSLNQTRRNILLGGLERADSFNFNPQKVLSVARENSILVTKNFHGKLLRKFKYNDGQCSTLSNPLILNQNQVENIGEWKKNFFNGQHEFHMMSLNRWFPERRQISFKIWYQWKAKGFRGLGEHLEYVYALANNVTDEIRTRYPAFILPSEKYKPQSPHVNFYFVPKRLRSIPTHSTQFWSQMTGIQGKVTARLTLERKIILTTMTTNAPRKEFDSARNYLLIGMQNSAFTLEHAKDILNAIQEIGEKL